MPSTRPARALLLVRALFSLAGLGVLVVGIPAALWEFGQLPKRWTSPAQWGEVMMSPDDGSLLLAALTVAGWVLWAWLALPLVIEAGALATRRVTPRLPGMATPQRLASYLLGALLVASPAAAASAATPATAASAPAVAHSPATGQQDNDTTPGVSAREASEPVHRVSADNPTLWGIAQERLGDGARWKDIQALNPGVQRGQDLAEGKVLRMPSDTPPQKAPASSSAEDEGGQSKESAETHVVKQDENLWGIAGKRYGDPTEWRTIADANPRVVTDPDVIHPGDKLTLPSQRATPSDGDSEQHHQHKQQQNEQEKKEKDEVKEKPGAGQDSDRHQTDPSTPALEQESKRPSAQGDRSPAPSPGSDRVSKAPASADEADSPDTGATLSTLAAAGAIVAAGVVGGLYVRRSLQQRRRRRGRRIPMPKGKAARTEADLRATEPPVDLDTLAAMLRTAAAHLVEEEREFPPVRAVVLGRKVELYLAEPAPPVPPFTAGTGMDRWTCPARTQELLDAGELDEVELPLPGLVTLGTTAQDQLLVLVDLESVGVLRLTGPARHLVARSLAVELALTPLAEALEVLLAEDLAPGLARVCERLTAHDELGEQVVDALRAHHDEQQRALSVLGMDSLRTARLTAVGAGGWTPRVVMVDAAEEPAAAAAVAEVAAQEPRTATAVIVTADEQEEPPSPDTTAPEAGWILRTDADGAVVTVPGTDLECLPHAINDDDYADILELLATADADHDEPGPDEADLPKPPLVQTPDSPTAHHDAGNEDAKQPPRPEPEQVVGQRADERPQPNIIVQLADLGLIEDEEPDAEAEEGDSPPAPGAGVVPAGETPHPAEVPDGAPRTSADPATGPNGTGTAEEDGPMVRVLGSVEVLDARGKVETKRHRAATELVAFLACTPGAERAGIEEALWRGRSVQRRTVTELISRTRAWLGTRPDGGYYFPVIADSRSRYALEGVALDWQRFQDLAASGERTSGEEGTRALRQALELVRGRPFAGIPPYRYVWAEPLIQDMIAAIVDTSELLAERYLVQRKAREALWAAVRGLDAAPEAEQLRRHQFTALHALGDMDGLKRAVTELDAINEDLGVDADETTLETLRALTSRA